MLHLTSHYYLLLANIARKSIHVPKHMVMAQATDPPNTITITEIRLIDCVENSSSETLDQGENDERVVIAAVHYKPTVDKNTQMERHNMVEKTDRENPETQLGRLSTPLGRVCELSRSVSDNSH